jgi:hypothetical protein
MLPYIHIKGLFDRVLALKTVLEHHLYHGAAMHWNWDSSNVFGRAQAPTFLSLSHCYPGPILWSLHFLPPVWSRARGARPDAPMPMAVRWRTRRHRGDVRAGRKGNNLMAVELGSHSGMPFARCGSQALAGMTGGEAAGPGVRKMSPSMGHS